MLESSLTRRSFLAGSATALTAASYRRVMGANERIGVGFVGYGLIGKRHVIDFQEQPDVDMLGVAEAHAGRRDEAVGFIGGGVKGYADFRQLYDRNDVQAVVISTPDHWHALQTMMACAAGKDVYVEKPVTLFANEGRWMLEVAKRHKSVVQVGTQQRSGKHYQAARELLQQGKLGKIVAVRAQSSRNVMPGFGNPPDQKPPPELDWEMWQGPAPARAYNPNRAIYHFRWFWDYSGGQMTNLGQHSLDIVDWVLGVQSLQAVSSAGGRFCLQDNGETPDTQDACFEFGNWTATWSHREGSRGTPPEYGLEFCGTLGSLAISRKGYRITGDPDLPPEVFVPQFTGAHPVGGPKATVPSGPRKYRVQSVEDKTGDDRAQFKAHVRNFLDCMVSRKSPISDLESGHRVSSMCHLANVSLRLGRKLKWDATQETIRDDAAAAAWLTRPYRAPWDKELVALKVG